MNEECVSDPGLAMARRRWGLLAIALSNLAIATAMDALAWSGESTRRPDEIVCTFCILNGILYGQATVLGVLAALVPRRSLVGLSGIAAYTIVFGYSTWLVHFALSFLTRGVPFIGVFFALLAIAMLIVLMGARMLLGWRVSAVAPPDQQPRGQFHLANLLELMVLCGTWLGLNLVLEHDGMRGLMALVFARFIARFVLIGVPILFATLADRPPPIWIILGFCLWYVFVDVGLDLIPIHDGDSVGGTLRRLPQHAQMSGGFLLAISVNGLVLRRLGYRWHTRKLAS